MTEQTQDQAVEQTEVAGKTRIAPPVDKYVATRSASGGKSMHNGDPIATALAGQPIDAVYLIAAEMLTGVTADDLKAKYAHLNVGQQRMNLGNRIRGAVNKMDKAVEAKTEGAIPGAAYLAQIVEGYPLPQPEVKAEATEEAAAE